VANLTEAALPVIGQVLDIQPRKDYETKAPAGADVAIGTGNGFANVRLDEIQLNELKPVLYARVTWLGRARAWSSNGGSADVRYAFVGLVDEGYMDRIASEFKNSSKVSA